MSMLLAMLSGPLLPTASLDLQLLVQRMIAHVIETRTSFFPHRSQCCLEDNTEVKA